MEDTDAVFVCDSFVDTSIVAEIKAAVAKNENFVDAYLELPDALVILVKAILTHNSSVRIIWLINAELEPHLALLRSWLPGRLSNVVFVEDGHRNIFRTLPYVLMATSLIPGGSDGDGDGVGGGSGASSFRRRRLMSMVCSGGRGTLEQMYLLALKADPPVPTVVLDGTGKIVGPLGRVVGQAQPKTVRPG